MWPARVVAGNISRMIVMARMTRHRMYPLSQTWSISHTIRVSKRTDMQSRWKSVTSYSLETVFSLSVLIVLRCRHPRGVCRMTGSHLVGEWSALGRRWLVTNGKYNMFAIYAALWKPLLQTPPPHNRTAPIVGYLPMTVNRP